MTRAEHTTRAPKFFGIRGRVLEALILLAVGCATTAAEPRPQQPATRASPELGAPADHTGQGSGESDASAAATQQEIEGELKQRVTEAQAEDRVAVSVGVQPASRPARRVLVWVAHLHGTGVQMLDLGADTSNVAHLTSILMRELPPPDLSAAPARVELASSVIAAPVAERVLRRAVLAMSADIQIATPESDDAVVLRSLKVVHDTQVINVQLWAQDGSRSERAFVGQPGNLTEPQRAPLDLILEDLLPLTAAAQPVLGNATRAILVDAWPSTGMPAWIRCRLIALASALPSPRLVALLRPSLDETGEVRVRAINALAAAVGEDLRRDATGGVRPIDEVAEAYRELLTK